MHNRTAFETRARRMLGYTNFRREGGQYCHQPLNELWEMDQAAFEEGARAERTRAQMAKWGGRRA